MMKLTTWNSVTGSEKCEFMKQGKWLEYWDRYWIWPEDKPKGKDNMGVETMEVKQRIPQLVTGDNIDAAMETCQERLQKDDIILFHGEVFRVDAIYQWMPHHLLTQPGTRHYYLIPVEYVGDLPDDIDNKELSVICSANDMRHW